MNLHSPRVRAEVREFCIAAARCFRANGWTWPQCLGVPGPEDIEEWTWRRISDLGGQWGETSSGRIRVRLTADNELLLALDIQTIYVGEDEEDHADVTP